MKTPPLSISESRRLSLLALGVLLCLFCLFASAVGTQAATDALPEEISQRVHALAWENKLNEQQVASLLQVLSQAQRNRVPLDPLVQKIEEGLAKNVPPTRIAEVISRKAGYLEPFALALEQRARMTTQQKKSYLARIDNLLAMGIPEEEIRTRMQNGHGTPLDQVLNALESKAALKAAGLPDDSLDAVVTMGLEAGYFREPAWSLARVARAARLAGVASQRMAQMAMEVATGQRTLHAIASDLGLDYDTAVAGKGRSGAVTSKGARHGQQNGGGHGRSGNAGQSSGGGMDGYGQGGGGKGGAGSGGGGGRGGAGAGGSCSGSGRN